MRTHQITHAPAGCAKSMRKQEHQHKQNMPDWFCIGMVWTAWHVFCCLSLITCLHSVITWMLSFHAKQKKCTFCFLVPYARHFVCSTSKEMEHHVSCTTHFYAQSGTHLLYDEWYCGVTYVYDEWYCASHMFMMSDIVASNLFCHWRFLVLQIVSTLELVGLSKIISRITPRSHETLRTLIRCPG